MWGEKKMKHALGPVIEKFTEIACFGTRKQLFCNRNLVFSSQFSQKIAFYSIEFSRSTIFDYAESKILVNYKRVRMNIDNGDICSRNTLMQARNHEKTSSSVKIHNTCKKGQNRFYPSFENCKLDCFPKRGFFSQFFSQLMYFFPSVQTGENFQIFDRILHPYRGQLLRIFDADRVNQ